MRIQLNQTTAALRRFALERCVSDADGVTPMTGLTFAASELKIGKQFTEANYAGTVTEIADGFYYYGGTAGEVDTLGSLTARVTKADVRSSMVEHQVVNTP